jgi:hypothetical protein
MKRLTKTIVAGVVLALALPAGASARGLHLTEMQLDVRVTGTHTVSWHLTEGAYPEPDRSWVDGHGDQTLRFRSPKVRYLATAVSGHLPHGVTPSPLGVSPLGGMKPFTATLERQGEWKTEDPPLCDREGGCAGEVLPVPIHQNPDCPAKQVQVGPYLETVWTKGHGSKKSLRLKFPTVSMSNLWSSCPPDMDGATRPLYVDQPGELAFGGAIKQIVHLAVGETLTLKAASTVGAVGGVPTAGECPTLSGMDRQECAVTKASVAVTRVR